MPISIVGDGSITGLTAGGLPDASVVDLDLATGISSSKLTGVLPALDGSSLTNLPAGGVDGIVSSANATAITIDANEQIGINSTPSHPLHITKEKGGYQAYFNNDNGAADGLKIRIKANDAGVFNILKLTSASTGSDVDALVVTDDGRGLSQFTAKSWVNFSGENVVTVRDSHNVSSVTDVGTGRYAMNFSNNMANSNYMSATHTRHDFWQGSSVVESYDTSKVNLAQANGQSTFGDASTYVVVVFGD